MIVYLQADTPRSNETFKQVLHFILSLRDRPNLTVLIDAPDFDFHHAQVQPPGTLRHSSHLRSGRESLAQCIILFMPNCSGEYFTEVLIRLMQKQRYRLDWESALKQLTHVLGGIRPALLCSNWISLRHHYCLINE